MNTGFDIPNALLLLTTAIGVYILLRERRSSRSRLRDREEWVKSYLKQNTHEATARELSPTSWACCHSGRLTQGYASGSTLGFTLPPAFAGWEKRC